MGIVVLGSVFVDIKGYPLANYIPAGRNAGRVVQVHGGVSRNVVEDIANLELRPTFVSLVDDTGAGRDVVDKLKAHKVDTRFIRVEPDSMGIWLAVFDNNGDVVASISKRPDLGALRELLTEEGDAIFADCDAIVLEADMEKDLLKPVLAYAQKYAKPVYGVVSNMSIASERRDLLQEFACLVCNQQEAGILFAEDYDNVTPDQMAAILVEKVRSANLQRMVVTMGGEGSVWADNTGACGICPAQKVNVVDTTGAGDSFFAGVAVGLTYGKTLAESCVIGTRLAASVIVTRENVCPRFLPAEFGLDINID